MSWSGVTARRMARHALTEPTDLGPAEVAGALYGARTQVLSAAELSVARRIAGAARADVRRALWEDRTLVKTFGVRGTCTCCRRRPAHVDRAAVGPCPRRRGPHLEPVRFTLEQASEIIAAMGDVLADTELTEAIMDRTGP